MADVFIAYSRANKAEVAQLAELLESQGYSVWWDGQVPVGSSFDEVIERELSASSAAIVIWTEASVKSRWVRAEANFAAQRKILIPVILGQLPINRLPLEFLSYHTLQLPALDALAAAQIFEAVAAITGKTPGKAARMEFPIAGQESKPDQETNLPWVFVSHVDTDKPRIRVYVERLLESGLNVFVDNPAKLGLNKKWIGSPKLNYIRYFDNYRVAISQALESSGCVLVFWSGDSVQTERQIFWDEVEFGSANGFLVSTMIDDVINGSRKIPKGYGFSQANIADLSSDAALDAEFDWVISDIKKLLSEYGRRLKLQSAPRAN